jgi:Leucine-rich repeat (LRR) protein
LENIDITGCDKLESIKLSNLGMISSLTIPASIKTVDISQCPLLKTLSITYSSSSSISNLESVSIDSCDGLETVDLTGQNNTALVINLVGAKNLKNLYVGSTKYASLTLPNLYTVDENGEKVKYFKSLERLNISNTEISSLKFNDSAENFLDLRNFEDLNYINA